MSQYSVRIGQYIFSFQANVYTFQQYSKNNNLRPQRNELINTLTESQAILRALTKSENAVRN